jgi:hypothetical protein
MKRNYFYGTDCIYPTEDNCNFKYMSNKAFIMKFNRNLNHYPNPIFKKNSENPSNPNHFLAHSFKNQAEFYSQKLIYPLSLCKKTNDNILRFKRSYKYKSR